MNRSKPNLSLGDALGALYDGDFGSNIWPNARHDWEVVHIAVADQAASEARPQVKMRFDEPRQSDHVCPVDHFHSRRREVRADGNDQAVSDVHIAARQVANFRVHAHDVSVADNKLRARGKPRSR